MRPPDLAHQLGKKLAEWTGERWVVTINSEADGKPTLSVQQQDARAAAWREAEENPLVKAAMAAFPGAEITDIRSLDDNDDAEGTDIKQEGEE